MSNPVTSFTAVSKQKHTAPEKVTDADHSKIRKL